jgi:iron complex outermembrane receptor protein
MKTFKRSQLAVGISIGLLSLQAYAAEVNAQITDASALSTQTSQQSKENTLPTIVLTAVPLNQTLKDTTTPVNVVRKDQLLAGGTTLGNALAGQVGVHADTFGGGASRPVIRGQTSPRVKVLSDGSEVMDASGISPDHAVTVDPMLAQKIEVLRGPATLLYGGGAIGGVVNVIDSKIPTRMPKNGMEGELNLRANTVADEKAGAAGVTIGLGDQFALRVEGSKRDANDYIAPLNGERRVDGSYSKGETGSVGFSWIGDKGFAGLSFTQRKDEYGLPGHSHAYEACHLHDLKLHCDEHEEEGEGHEHEEEGHEHGEDGHDHAHDHEHAAVPWIELDSKRWDFRAEYNQPFSGIEKIKVRAGYTDYQHDEVEEGTVATSFKNKGYDGRIELTHVPVAGLRGVFGVQYAHSDFKTDGEEAFLPETVTENISAFLLEHYQWRDVRFELGARHEWQTITPDSTDSKFSSKEFDESATSVSAGAKWEFIPDYALSLSLSRSERLPQAQELYANGGHFATNTFELGNADLGKETSNNIELGLRKTAGDLTFAVNAYHNQVDDYIYAKTLDQFEAFRLIQYTQGDASFNGLEAETSYRFSDMYTGTLFGDYVRGKLKNDGNLPRIPSARVGGRINADWDAITGSVEVYRSLKQDDIASYENETSGYNMVNASIAYKGDMGERSSYKLYMQMNNLFDARYYNHSSFLSSIPQQGRNFTAGVQFKF